MKVWNTISKANFQLESWHKQGYSIFLVPTMGNLHEGHLSLVDCAFETRKKSKVKIICSIFVNPMQFGPNEDFTTYPRTQEADLEYLSEKNCDAVWLLDKSEVCENPEFITKVVPNSKLVGKLEDAYRPTHFSGVLTIVLKLFNLIQPQVAIFGQKDFQQFKIIQQMIADLNLKTKAVMAPTVRDKNGLALSSRNNYLTNSEKARACVLHESLLAMSKELEKNLSQTEVSNEELLQFIARMQKKYSFKITAEGFKVDYLEILDRDLQIIQSVKSKKVAIGAIRVGKTRLLDNVLF